MFRDDHPRVGNAVAEDGVALPRRRFDATATGLARLVSPIEQPGVEAPSEAAPGWVDWDMFDGVLDAADRLLALAWREAAGAVPSGAAGVTCG